jgi:hypothetical protein
VIVASVLVSAAGLARSARDVVGYPGIDLRARSTAGLALLRGLNPYAYDAGPGAPPELLDYTRHYASRSESTNTPTVLLAYGAFANLQWTTQRVIWFALEWGAFGAALLLLVRMTPRVRHRIVLLALALFFFAGGYFWRFHVERGQTYVFLVLLETFAVALASGRLRGDGWFVGVPFGLAAILRPNMLVMAPVLWAVGLRRTALSTVSTAIAVVLLSLPVTGLAPWLEFNKAVAFWEQVKLGNPSPGESLAPAYRPSPLLDGYDYTQGAELIGFDRSLTLTAGASRVLPPIVGPVATYRWWPVVPKLVTIVVTIAFTILAWTRRRQLSLHERIGLAILTTVVVDYILPPIRVVYADVLFLVPLALFLPAMLRRDTPSVFVALVLAGLAVGHNQRIWDGNFLVIAVRSAGVLAGLLGVAWWRCRVERSGQLVP